MHAKHSAIVRCHLSICAALLSSLVMNSVAAGYPLSERARRIRFKADALKIAMPQGVARLYFGSDTSSFKSVGNNLFVDSIRMSGVNICIKTPGQLAGISVISTGLAQALQDFGAVSLDRRIGAAAPGDTIQWNAIRERWVTVPDLSVFYTILVDNSSDVDSIKARLAWSPGIDDIGGVGWAVADFPDDPKFPEQWALHDTGAAMRFQAAWTLSDKRGDLVRIAILDHGIKRLTPSGPHIDLRGNILDGGDSTAYIFEQQHGSWVAGIANAVTNNNIGMAAAAPDAKMLIYNLADEDPVEDDIFNAAILENSRVMNMSWHYTGGQSLDTAALHNAIIVTQLVYEVVFVASTGTDLIEGGQEITYFPAAWSEVIAVGASDQTGQRAWCSHYTDSIDFVAPGVDIVVPNPLHDGYVTKPCGTSFSVPHITGLVAMLLSRDGYHDCLTAENVKDILQQSAHRNDTLDWDKHLGWGLIDAEAVMAYCPVEMTGDVNETGTITGADIMATSHFLWNLI